MGLVSASPLPQITAKAPKPQVIAPVKCIELVDTLQRVMCWQGFRTMRYISRLEIPIPAPRVHLQGLPHTVAFADGDTLLIVQNTPRTHSPNKPLLTQLE